MKNIGFALGVVKIQGSENLIENLIDLDQIQWNLDITNFHITKSSV